MSKPGLILLGGWGWGGLQMRAWTSLNNMGSTQLPVWWGCWKK